MVLVYSIVADSPTPKLIHTRTRTCDKGPKDSGVEGSAKIPLEVLRHLNKKLFLLIGTLFLSTTLKLSTDRCVIFQIVRYLQFKLTIFTTFNNTFVMYHKGLNFSLAKVVYN